MGPLTSSSAARRNDEDTLREAPPPATAVKFHSCAPQGVSRASRAGLDPNKILSNIGRTGPTLKHIEAFNITLVNEVPLVILLPAGFLPPRLWLDDLNSTEDSDFTTPPSHARPLSNGAAAPGTEIFHDVAKELLYENGDAFRAARRQNPLPGHEPPRVLHTRKFWNGLADMAEYWDTSLDKYIEGSEEHNKDAMDIDELRSEAKRPNETMNTDTGKAAIEKTAKKTMYTGRRRGTGHTMPNEFRQETVFAFVEMVAWPFHCRVERAKVEHVKNRPKISVLDMAYPLEHLGSVYRTPKDSRKARIGILEGPMMGIFCREQNQYRNPKKPVSEEKEGFMDLLKETGLMAMLAQRRAREGRKEVFPGAGQWWTTTPRWGGGQGGECGTTEDEAKEAPAMEQDSRQHSKQPTPVEEWQAMKPPKSLWETNVTYQQIGSDKPSVYDNVSYFRDNFSFIVLLRIDQNLL